jgi:hypothetical protein
MYDYRKERDKIFTDEGQRTFLKVRDRVQHLLKEAGAARMLEILRGLSGDTWILIACVDRMFEIGELLEVTQPDLASGQYRVFISGKRIYL